MVETQLPSQVRLYELYMCFNLAEFTYLVFTRMPVESDCTCVMYFQH